MPITLDATSKALAIASAAIAVFAAWKALPLDERLVGAEHPARRHRPAPQSRGPAQETRVRPQAQLRPLPGGAQDPGAQGQDRQGRRGPARADRVARRGPLPLQAAQRAGRQRHCARGPLGQRESKFYEVQAQLAQQNAAPLPAAATKAASTAIGSMDIDVYCAAKQASWNPLRASLSSCSSPARPAAGAALPADSVNQQPGYGITANEDPLQRAAGDRGCKLLAQCIGEAGARPRCANPMQPTKWYISVFVCQ